MAGLTEAELAEFDANGFVTVDAVPPPLACRTMLTSIAISLSRSCEEIKVQAPFNSWSLAVGVRCCSLHAVACISRGSCPSLTG